MVPKDATVTTSTATTTNTEIPVKLVYSKSKVYVHPSTNASDYIPGYISIVEKASHDYLIAWTPEAEILSKDIDAYVKIDSNPEENNEDVSSTFMLSSIADLPERHSLYALSIPLNDVRSLLVHPPSFTKWYGSIVINFQDGSSSAPLWFHDDESRSTVLQKNTQGGKFSEDRPGNNKNQQVRWGGDEFIYRLNQLIFIQQSKEEKHLYLVGENQPRKSQDESTTPEEGKNTNNNNSSSSSATKSTQTSTGSSSGSGSNHQFDTSVFDSTQMDPWVATWKEFKWSALEKLSRITTFTRNTTAAATSQVVPHLPPKIQMVLNTDAVRATTQDYDSARIYLAKWAADLAARSEQDTPLERRYRHVGIWGHGDAWEEETALGVFEVLNSENDFSIPTHTRTKPITKEEWDSFFDHDTGKLSVGEPYIRKRIFCGGLDPSIRREAWLFLTNVYPWDSTAAEREKLTSEYRESYVKIRSRWLDDPQVRESAHFLDQKHRIDKDVHRTDRTVGFYAKEDMPNPDPIMHVGTNKNLEKLKELLCTYNMLDNDLGYVQGMSDLLSPLYMVIGDDELVFQAFVGFMNRTKSNFYMDQTGMRRHLMTMDALLQFMDPKLFKHLQRTDSDNLFFCFRWFLVWFKRELSWDDTLTMWEVLWSDYLTEYFTFFVALSILDQHRDAIIDYLQSFDEILKYINDLSMAINLQETLQRAEILYYQFRQRVEAVDNKKQKMQEILSTKNKEGEGDVDDEEQRKQAEKDLSKLPDMNEYLRRLYSGNDAYEKNNSSSSLNEKH
ncbi:rab-GTPase-TBC domain-containing protein [Phascolomyces articulosus]|uniref:GTPase-activating protein GYP7 n=1 Tax=Phascolomyces articulosus TaxID=60185 RepID=A0AAD5KB51_9FUNG|nr:rab-GTPase-TBC domain-containing protein [Phascolomyces articulosus]